ncbi:MAG TPA: hypothetical protein VKT21_02115 [Thermoplasmata archaeon]|nr:hypothetical protein [Thermoplasmata archaeon]
METLADPAAARARTEAVLSVAVALCGTLLGVGGVMFWVTPAALLPPGPLAAGLETAFVVAGGGGLLGLFLGLPRATVRALRSTVPHMFPFGSVPLDVALYLLVFAVVTCSTHALFDVFTGADNGGQIDGLAHQNALDLILAGASAVVYLATLFAVFLVARVVHLGRAIDRHRRVDPYRTGTLEPEELAVWVPPTGPAAPPSRYARPVLYAVSVLVALGLSAAVQLFEVSLEPATPMQWLAGQAFTPLWALLTAGALAYLDAGTRALEVRYVSVVPSAPPGARGPRDAAA